MKPSPGRSLQICTAPSGERSPSSSQYWWERFTHLYSWADWSNESKVPCSRKQQQQQLTGLGIEPGTLRSPGQCSNHRAVLPLYRSCYCIKSPMIRLSMARPFPRKCLSIRDYKRCASSGTIVDEDIIHMICMLFLCLSLPQ